MLVSHSISMSFSIHFPIFSICSMKLLFIKEPPMIKKARELSKRGGPHTKKARSITAGFQYSSDVSGRVELFHKPLCLFLCFYNSMQRGSCTRSRNFSRVLLGFTYHSLQLFFHFFVHIQ